MAHGRFEVRDFRAPGAQPLADFLALLRAAQPDKVRQKLQEASELIIGLDGMQPEKGNTGLYIVREVQLRLVLMAENLDDSTYAKLRKQLLEPLKALAKEFDLKWQGIISDAQKSIRIAVAKSLPGFHIKSACSTACGTPVRPLSKQIAG